MADKSKIEWTEATWNIITGCSVVSPGCTNCYAMKLAGTRLRNHSSRLGLTRPTKAGPVWTGEVRFNEEWIDQPIQWKRPRMIFVAAHGDLFHEKIPDRWLDRVFLQMTRADHHTFQVLTKRIDRACAYLEKRTGPILNVWIGASAEDQTRANERAPYLTKISNLGYVTFLSLEPLLGPIDLFKCDLGPDPDDDIPRVYWVIVGGESGNGARFMEPDWARALLIQCRAAGIPFFMKQMTKKAEIPADLFVREMPQ